VTAGRAERVLRLLDYSQALTRTDRTARPAVTPYLAEAARMSARRVAAFHRATRRARIWNSVPMKNGCTLSGSSAARKFAFVVKGGEAEPRGFESRAVRGIQAETASYSLR